MKTKRVFALPTFYQAGMDPARGFLHFDTLMHAARWVAKEEGKSVASVRCRIDNILRSAKKPKQQVRAWHEAYGFLWSRDPFQFERLLLIRSLEAQDWSTVQTDMLRAIRKLAASHD